MKKGKKLKYIKNDRIGFVPEVNVFVSAQPYIKTVAIYDSARDCFLGKSPIKILSIGVVDPKGVTIPRAPKPAINTVYEGKMYVKQSEDL